MWWEPNLSLPACATNSAWTDSCTATSFSLVPRSFSKPSTMSTEPWPGSSTGSSVVRKAVTSS